MNDRFKTYIPSLLGVIFVLAIIAVWSVVGKAVHLEKSSPSPCDTIVAQQQSCSNEVAAGGYSPYREILQDERMLFDSVYRGEVHLTPIAVSTQVVAGTNYRFRCSDVDGQFYEVIVFVPLPCNQSEQQVQVTDIHKQ